MSKQRHDIGNKKRRSGMTPMPGLRLKWMRLKRRHPGPLPEVLREFKSWLDAGRPTRF